MTYKIYIKKNNKPVIREISDSSFFGDRGVNRVLVAALCIATGLILGMRSHDIPQSLADRIVYTAPAYSLSAATEQSIHTIEPMMESLTTGSQDIYVSPINQDEDYVLEETEAAPDQDIVNAIIPDDWGSMRVQSGDSLSVIFDRLHISPQVLHEIMSLGKDVDALKHLMPDQELRFQLADGQLEAMEYDISPTNTLHIRKQGLGYAVEKVVTELETRINFATGVITDSLFLTAQRSGLSDNLTMQLIDLYAWDIDFALDIREGDRFYVVYEENFKDGVKVQDGPILSAEFINQEQPFRTVRYTHQDGYTNYYNQEGFSMRKAFLRTPVNFTRISSGFTLARKHPVLNKIRAHRGVDYAAPSGTPIKATGDGIVTYAGTKGGYGKVVILRHGEKYSTLYGHMSRFAPGINAGQRVKQGQTIGYVGMTGLATGPHLHYEFRINDVHHNPLTVQLPKALGIPGEIMADFRAKTQPLLAQLDDVIAGRARSSLAMFHKINETGSPSE